MRVSLTSGRLLRPLPALPGAEAPRPSGSAAIACGDVIVGIPTEVKPGENRVALTPDGARELTAHGHRVLVESGAGAHSAIPDADFVAAGAELVDTEGAWSAELVCKVKEPQAGEFAFLRPDLVLFTYLHLAAYPAVADALLAAGTTAVGYETVRNAAGGLPLLAPMSEVAGRLAPQVGAHFLERAQGGRGSSWAAPPGCGRRGSSWWGQGPWA